MRAVSVSTNPGIALRRRRPCNELLPATTRWMATLPLEVRPTALTKQFPRIANALAHHWAQAAERERYIEDLLVDRRGHRRGFPVDVLEDLLALDDYCRGRYPEQPPAGSP